MNNNNKQEQAKAVTLKSGRDVIIAAGKLHVLLNSAEVSFIFNAVNFAISQLMPEVLENSGGLADSEGNTIDMQAYIESMKNLFSQPPYNNENFLACIAIDFQLMIDIAIRLEAERNKPQPKIITIH